MNLLKICYVTDGFNTGHLESFEQVHEGADRFKRLGLCVVYELEGESRAQTAQP